MKQELLVAVAFFCTSCSSNIQNILISGGTLEEAFPFSISNALVFGQSGTNQNDNMVRGLNGPTDFLVVSDDYIVVDQNNHRLLTYSNARNTNDNGITPSSLLGQPHLEQSDRDYGQEDTNAQGFYGIHAGELDNDCLIVSDALNHRVLLFDYPENTEAIGVIGQLNFEDTIAGTSATELRNPRGLTISDHGGQKTLWIADSGNHRVLGFHFDTCNDLHQASADLVLGQPDFDSDDLGSSDQGLNLPLDVHWVDPYLLIADTANNRVTVHAPLPAQNHAAALYVLGQPNFISTSPAVNEQKFYEPAAIHSSEKQLVISDRGNNRVLFYSLEYRLSTFRAADAVLGQPDFFSNSVNGGAPPSELSFDYPNGLNIHEAASQTRLAVADTRNDRVLFFDLGEDEAPLNGAPATRVLGFDAFSDQRTNASIVAPKRAFPHQGRFIATDPDRNRILIFPEPSMDAPPAETILGQNDEHSEEAGFLPGSFDSPHEAIIDPHGRLFISDTENHRVLVYNSLPTTTGKFPPDHYIGQLSPNGHSANIIGGGGTPTSFSLNSPKGLAYCDDWLWVADVGNHRILGYDLGLGFSAPNFADRVLGQADFLTDQFGAGPNQMNQPTSVACTSTHIFVVDTNNHRVLRFPIDSDTPDRVLGHGNGVDALDRSFPNDADAVDSDPIITGAVMNAPSCVWTNGSQLIITDEGNHRILVYSEMPLTNGEMADIVIGHDGQADRGDINGGGDVSTYGLKNPSCASISSDLYLSVADYGNERVVLWPWSL